ncbi:FtsX-like permease family protein [Pseudonocardia humida]|uniref:ABC transporter permease n=1 Tax=Pseudonocardia humida TaxID=2800819 RepID=A0ABT1A161_9PSEU|nr:FtsX-like permease family protein [Pseudonocardia humida]MCO1656730.1 ABC transporter permease [Pseudonocardia humida]
MLGLSRATFRQRWPLFVGAALTVCIGVALVQSSLLVLISAATLPVPAGLAPAARAAFVEGSTTAVTLSALTLAFSAFLAVFIVSSTFAFTVAQRRPELALLRLVGAGRGAMRRLLVGEAVLLAIIGTAAGIPVGLAATRFQSGLLVGLGMVPDGFNGEWRSWILGVSAGVGIGVSLAGVLVAARRAGRVRPLEALRDTGDSARVMTATRWVAGLLFLAGGIALVILTPIGGAAGGQALGGNAALCLAVALSALSPLLVPVVARLIPVRGPVGELAVAALGDGVRRSAATAAPVIVLVGLVLAQATMLTSTTAAGAAEQRRATAGDLVLDATGPVGGDVTDLPGVAWASTEVVLPLTVSWGSGDDVEREDGQALVVDPAAYATAHPGREAVEALRGGRVAVAGPGAGAGSPGDTVGVLVGGSDLGPLPIVAGVPDAIGGGADLLLTADAVPAAELAAAPSRTVVALAPDADRDRVLAALAALGTVSTVPDWIAADTAARETTTVAVFTVIMGLGGLYALIGVVNAVVVGAAPRPAEFATARLSGLTRRQVLRAALLESAAVTTVGLLLGGLAAGGSFIAVLALTATMTGVATLAVPWALIGLLAGGLYLVTAVTSALATWSGTRRAPVSLLGATT